MMDGRAVEKKKNRNWVLNCDERLRLCCIWRLKFDKMTIDKSKNEEPSHSLLLMEWFTETISQAAVAQ